MGDEFKMPFEDREDPLRGTKEVMRAETTKECIGLLATDLT